MFHLKKIRIDDCDVSNCNKDLPKRRDFLNDSDVKEQYNKINKGEEVYFLGNDVKECLPFNDYFIIISGILPCGAKTILEINNIYPYFDIKLDQDLSDNDNKKIYRNLLTNEKIIHHKMSIVEGKDLMYHSFNTKKYLRISFKNLYTRKKCINLLTDKNIETYNNDLSCYYRVVAREYKINLSSWNTIINYEDIKKKGKYKSKYQLTVSINDIKAVDQDIVLANQSLSNDKLISACFDIEMYTPDLAKIPSGKCSHDIVFMLCVTFQYINEPKSFLNVCLVTKECDNQADLFTIVCDNEKTLLKLFSKLMNRMQPDFITEFNGSEFDWKVIVDKASYYKLLKFMCKNMSIENLNDRDLEVDNINKWMIKSENIKIEADRSVTSYNIKLFGYIPFDTRIIFKKLFPIEPKSSLNFYLGKMGLDLKDDMDFRVMFKIYESGTSEEMAKVAHYCYIDSYRLHELLMSKNVIKDKRELASLSYTIMFDSFYRADGLRVRNLIISHCLDQGLFYNNILKDSPERDQLKGVKYPGATVLNPIKGLVANIYNIKEFATKNNYNINDDEMDILYNVIADEYDNIFILKKKSFNVDIEMSDDAFDCLKKYIKYIRENEIKYPVSGLDFSSLYPSEIMARNFSPEYIIKDPDYYNQIRDKVLVHEIHFELTSINLKVDAYSVLTNDKKERVTGVFPSILIALFNERVKVKKILQKFINKIEELDNLEKNEPGLHRSTPEYKDCILKYNYYNAKQGAIKVFMNTFYGETGNAISPLFLLPIAGGITTDGKKNLMMVKDHIENKLDVKVYYGDSVTGDTPVIIKKGFIIKIMAIKDILWDKSTRIEQHDEKEVINVNADDYLEVYTENGFTPIKKCIRHHTNKQLFRITTNSGMVDVTEDHSLLNLNKERITPSECDIGTDLLHWDNLMYKNPDPIYNMQYSCMKPIVVRSKNQVDLQVRFLILFNQGHKNISLSFEDGEYVLRTNLVNDNYDLHEEPNMIKNIELIGNSDDYVYDLETESHHFAAGIGRLVVHNTDSLYISCPKQVYADLDKQYYTNKISKLEYSTKLVEYTFVDIDRIKTDVNKLLMKDNGTPYLKMSYEEVLFPVVFLSKKKYFGNPHISIANFKPPELFKKGLEMKKRGVSQVLVKIYSQIMWESMNLENLFTLKEIVIKYIEILFTTKWDINDFIKSLVWNPNKDNKQTHTFVNRMMKLNKPIPGVGNRFNYVVVKRYPFTYDIKGRQKKLSVGDKMEYVEAIEAEQLEIDLAYYFGNELIGQFARLITYEPSYEVYVNDVVSDKLTYENCKKVVESFAIKYNGKYINVGNIHKKLYRSVKKQMSGGILNPQLKCITMNSAESFEDFIKNIKENIKLCNNSNMANRIVKKSIDMKVMYKIFENKKYKVSYYTLTINALNQMLDEQTEKLYDVMSQGDLFNKLLNYNENNITNIIQFIKTQYNFDNKCIEQADNIKDIDVIIKSDDIKEIVKKEELYESIDESQLNQVFRYLTKIISTYKMILLNEQIREVLLIKKNKAVGLVTKPKNFKV